MINNRGQDAGYGTLAGPQPGSAYDLMKSVQSWETSLQTGAIVASDTAKMAAQLQAEAKAGVISKLDLQLMGALIDVEKIAGDSKIAKEAGIELGTYLAIKQHIKALKLPASVQQIPGFGPCVLTVFKKMKADALAQRSKTMLTSLEENIDFKLEQVVVASQPKSKELLAALKEDYERTKSDIKKILAPRPRKDLHPEYTVPIDLGWYKDPARKEALFGTGHEKVFLAKMMNDLTAEFATDTPVIQPLNYIYDILNPERGRPGASGGALPVSTPYRQGLNVMGVPENPGKNWNPPLLPASPTSIEQAILSGGWYTVDYKYPGVHNHTWTNEFRADLEDKKGLSITKAYQEGWAYYFGFGIPNFWRKYSYQGATDREADGFLWPSGKYNSTTKVWTEGAGNRVRPWEQQVEMVTKKGVEGKNPDGSTKEHLAVKLPKWMTGGRLQQSRNCAYYGGAQTCWRGYREPSKYHGVHGRYAPVVRPGTYIPYGGWQGDRKWDWASRHDNHLTKGHGDEWTPMYMHYGTQLREWAVAEYEKDPKWWGIEGPKSTKYYPSWYAQKVGKAVQAMLPGSKVNKLFEASVTLITLPPTIDQAIKTERVLNYLINRNRLVEMRMGGFLLNDDLREDFDKYFSAVSQPHMQPGALYEWAQKQKPSKGKQKAGRHHLYGTPTSGKYMPEIWDRAIEDAKLDKYVKGKLVKGGTYSPQVTGLLWDATVEHEEAKKTAKQEDALFKKTCAGMDKGLLAAVSSKITLEFYALYAKNDALAASGYAALASGEVEKADGLADAIVSDGGTLKDLIGKWKDAQKAMQKLQAAGAPAAEISEAMAWVAQLEAKIFALTFKRISTAGQAQGLASSAARSGNKADDRRILSRSERDNSTNRWGQEFTVYDPATNSGVTIVTDPSDGAKKDKQVAQDTNNGTKSTLEEVSKKLKEVGDKINQSMEETGTGGFTMVDDTLGEEGGAFDEFIKSQLPPVPPPPKEGFPWLAVAGLGLAAAGKIPLVAGAGVAALDVALRGKKKKTP